MKKTVSIILAILIVTAGFKVFVAKHYCRGELAGTKISFTGIEASCGMEENRSCAMVPESVSRHCCENEMQIAGMVDLFTQPVSPAAGHAGKIVIYDQSLPTAFVTCVKRNPSLKYHSVINPPGYRRYTDPSPEDICIFRI